MSLVFQLLHNETPENPAGLDLDLGNRVVRLSGISLVEAAAVGDVGMSDISFDDPDGTLDIPGLYYFRVTENSLASNSIVWTGITGDKRISRAADTSMLTGAARRWAVDLMDENANLGFRFLRPQDGANRPAETAGARLAWIIARDMFEDHGFVEYPTNPMDAMDYAGRTYQDVLADIANVSGYNYWVRRRPADGRLGLFMFAPGSPAFGSPVRISNVAADLGAWTFAPDIEAELVQSPSRVASGVWLEYQGGSVYATNAATASNFIYRDLAAPMSTVSTLAKANALANRFLEESATEDERVTVTIRVPVDVLDDLLPGHRMQAKFSHLPDWQNWRWCRVMRRTLIQDQDTDESYRFRVELTPEVVTAQSACDNLTPSGSYYPMGSATSDATGYIVYAKPGNGAPTAITPNFVGAWNFPSYGAGGSGTIDYAGDCAQNTLNVYVRGSGTVTIHTATFSGSSRTLNAVLQHYAAPVWVTDASTSVTTGTDIVFEVPFDDYCEHRVEVTDNEAVCGGKWGFAGFTWAGDYA